MHTTGRILLALIAATIVSADYYIDPNTVPASTRKAWCLSELSTCPIICQQVPPGSTITNTCDPATLTYGCLCGNNLQPNVSEYSLTLPFFVCQEWGNQCVKNCGSDSTCASSCREDHPCGALDPQRNNKTTTAASTSSATPTPTDMVYTGFGANPTSTSDSAASALALEFGGSYGLVVVAGCLFAGAAVML